MRIVNRVEVALNETQEVNKVEIEAQSAQFAHQVLSLSLLIIVNPYLPTKQINSHSYQTHTHTAHSYFCLFTFYIMVKDS